MGTPSDASNPDFHFFRRKERTDSQEGEEEFRARQRKTEEEKTPDAEKELLHPEGTPETREVDSTQNQDAKAYKSHHNPVRTANP
ncbi:hypothetical protein NDU88_003460 [Pleurodeles waltl]|uniref:Uncharacterized protein n=1 Tax=Pleurodeles waltl TaxID=8319 RepID=A0AAV7T5I9_PLEWA|nr:hypothetical protein NDU88_003460 [Pleurodeles waltl]